MSEITQVLWKCFTELTAEVFTTFTSIMYYMSHVSLQHSLLLSCCHIKSLPLILSNIFFFKVPFQGTVPTRALKFTTINNAYPNLCVALHWHMCLCQYVCIFMCVCVCAHVLHIFLVTSVSLSMFVSLFLCQSVCVGVWKGLHCLMECL